jgi:hypothetical protein
MPQGAPGELALARLELPVSRRARRGTAPALRAVEASILQADDGSLLVSVRSEPPMTTYTLPALAALQFVGRVEAALAEALATLARR